MLLNDEQLKEDAKPTFEGYLEKVVDISLIYAPTSSESVGIAVGSDDPVSRRTAELSTSLGISNIRVIRKIEHYIHAIRPLLEGFDDDVFARASASLALFGWSHYQPGEAPTLEFLTAKYVKNIFGRKKEADIPPNEAAWTALLDAYGYSSTDEFDLVLLKGIQDGYFDPAEIEKHAREINEKILATKATGSFEAAWRNYHDSFADNKDEVLDVLHESFMKSFNYVTPRDLDATVCLFKELGRPNQAIEMIKHYVENREEGREFFDPEQYNLMGDITDPDVKEAFKSKSDKLETKRDVSAMLLLVAKGSWDSETISALSTTPVDEYRRVFKETDGADLRSKLMGAFQFVRIGNASPEMKEISKRAAEALKLIGAESDINARRVSRLV